MGSESDAVAVAAVQGVGRQLLAEGVGVPGNLAG